jgi:hypothetical protein
MCRVKKEVMPERKDNRKEECEKKTAKFSTKFLFELHLQQKMRVVKYLK